MKIRDFSFKMVGDGGIMFSRDFRLVDNVPEKVKGQDDIEYQMSTYKYKAHYDSPLDLTKKDCFAVIPSANILQSLIRSQTRGMCPIPIPSDKIKDMRFILTSGIKFNDPLYLYTEGRKVTHNDFTPLKSLVNNKLAGSLVVIRPVLKPWACEVNGQIINEYISKDRLETILLWIGIYSGMGTWSVRNGGTYGSFKVENLEIE